MTMSNVTLKREVKKEYNDIDKYFPGLGNKKIFRYQQLVLKCFKSLHKARKDVFREDLDALEAARTKINMEYRKNKSVEDVDSIKQMLQLSRDVEKELRTTVIQAKLVKPNVYEVRIRPDTQKLDNIPFQDYKA